MAAARSGDIVACHYVGRLADGSVFDSSREGEPLELIAGGLEFVEGVGAAIIGMSAGDSKTISLSPELGFGIRRPGLEQRVPRRLVPEDAVQGDPVEVKIGDGTIVLWVCELGDDFAVLDANHPLAGEVLEFDLEVMSVRSAA